MGVPERVGCAAVRLNGFTLCADHGRELQMAVTNGSGECYNPTEAGLFAGVCFLCGVLLMFSLCCAGSQRDLHEMRSTSQILSVSTSLFTSAVVSHAAQLEMC